ncbi:tyrosine-type recombinase/integrase [Elioraea thermophila]|uniref:tyrosine-type recombinase/integrase n=1 Tax=Elioraea thermophila TaxID=2185104 RepID=UPI001E35EFFB|nr:site-specific integrase [Elioraea thermophila]
MRPAAEGARPRRRPMPGTVAALIDAYQASEYWRALERSTQASYQRALDLIAHWLGDAPVRAITGLIVRKFHDRLAVTDGRPTPAKAAAAVRVLRLLLEAGRFLDCGTGQPFVTVNPAAKPGLSYRKRRQSQLWEAEDIRVMVAAADRLGLRSVATAILLNEWLGQRPGDLLALPPPDLADGWLRFRQSKRGRQVELPLAVVPHLVARLKAEAERPGAVISPTHLLVNDRTGRPWTEDAFKRAFAEVRAEAAKERPACARLWFMELRHTCITRLHEAGLDAITIAGVTGHSPESVQAVIDRHYLIRTRKAVVRAFKARLEAEGLG